MIDMMAADKPDAPADMKKKFHDMFVSHCQADAWSPQLIDCLNQMKALSDGDRCEAMMTEAQKNSLNDAMGPEPAPAAAPASATAPVASPPPAPAPTTQPAPTNSRSGTAKPGKSGDPCDGGN